MIRQEEVSCSQELLKEIEKLKQSYAQTTNSISYKLKEIVIKTICEKLLVKGFDSIHRKEKELLTNANRQLAEKASYLERSL